MDGKMNGYTLSFGSIPKHTNADGVDKRVDDSLRRYHKAS